MQKKQIGKIGENLAEKYLKKQGYKAVNKNFSTRFGEIDLIVKKNGLFVFVEVKTRLGFGQPEWGIDHKKIAKVQKMAQVYLIEEKLDYDNLRVDVICIDLNKNLKPEDIRHYENMTLDIISYE